MKRRGFLAALAAMGTMGTMGTLAEAKAKPEPAPSPSDNEICVGVIDEPDKKKIPKSKCLGEVQSVSITTWQPGQAMEPGVAEPYRTPSQTTIELNFANSGVARLQGYLFDHKDCGEVYESLQQICDMIDHVQTGGHFPFDQSAKITLGGRKFVLYHIVSPL